MPMTPRRLMRAVARRRRMFANRGDGVECTVCEHHFARFRDDWNRPNALCWRCGSHERHRALWLYLTQRPEYLRAAGSLLRFALEWCLERQVVAPGGWAIVMVPLDTQLRETYEDQSVTDPADRLREFLQHDHVRLYALDITDRLTQAGLA
jgi:hypothetical protein